jgi:hypothetical protein
VVLKVARALRALRRRRRPCPRRRNDGRDRRRQGRLRAAVKPDSALPEQRRADAPRQRLRLRSSPPGPQRSHRPALGTPSRSPGGIGHQRGYRWAGPACAVLHRWRSVKSRDATGPRRRALPQACLVQVLPWEAFDSVAKKTKFRHSTWLPVIAWRPPTPSKPAGLLVVDTEGGVAIATAALPLDERQILAEFLRRYGRRHPTGTISIPADCLEAHVRYTNRTPTNGLLREPAAVDLRHHSIGPGPGQPPPPPTELSDS